MTRVHAAVAVVCLALGSADVVYLNLAVAPALMADVTRPVSPADRVETAARARVATRSHSEGAGARLPPEAREIDPELTVRTGAEPEPESGAGLTELGAATGAGPAPKKLDDAMGEAAKKPETADAAAGVGAGADDIVDDGADALPSEPIHVLFERDEAGLGVAARARLERVALWMSAQAELRATIHGHADHRGDTTHNDELSRSRAESVADFLEERGITRARLAVRAFGERRPVDRRSHAQAFRRNRRVEIRISPPP